MPNKIQKSALAKRAALTSKGPKSQALHNLLTRDRALRLARNIDTHIHASMGLLVPSKQRHIESWIQGVAEGKQEYKKEQKMKAGQKLWKVVENVKRKREGEGKEERREEVQMQRKRDGEMWADLAERLRRSCISGEDEAANATA